MASGYFTVSKLGLFIFGTFIIALVAVVIVVWTSNLTETYSCDEYTLRSDGHSSVVLLCK